MPKRTPRINVSALLGGPTASPGVFALGSEEIREERQQTDQQIHMIEIACILDSPYQTREEVDEDVFAQLVASIKTEGFQNALTIRPYLGREGYYQILGGGHSRRDAAKAAGLTAIPVFIIDASDRSMAIRTAQENLARSDLNPVEAGKLFLKMRQDFSLTQDELAEALGMRDRYRIKQCEAAAQSAPEIQAMIKEKSTGGLRAMSYLRRLDDYPSERATIIEQFIQGLLTTEGVRVAVETVLGRQQSHRDVAKIEDVPQLGDISLDGKAVVLESTSELGVLSSAESNHQKGKTTPHPKDSLTQGEEQRTVSVVQAVERSGQVGDLLKRFQRYRRMLGNETPSEQECANLQQLVAQAGDILKRRDK